MITAENQVAPASQLSKDQARMACEHSIDFLAAIVLGELATSAFPPFYQAAWADIVSKNNKPTRDTWKCNINLPRGFVKTTLLKLACIHKLIFGKQRNILIAAATEGLASDVMADIVDALSNPTLVILFGGVLPGGRDTQTRKEFKYRGRTIVINAKGQGQAVRGTARNFLRPDLIICDDLQTRESSESKVEFEALKSWFYNTLLPCVAPEGAELLLSGNRYPVNSFVDLLIADPEWRTYSTGAVLADGNSLWEDLFSRAKLARLYQNATLRGPKAVSEFMAEYQNDPQSTKVLSYDLSAVAPYQFSPSQLTLAHSGSFIIVDPAGDKPDSDDTCIAYYERYYAENGLAYLVKRDLIAKQLDPEATIQSILALVEKHGCPDVWVESIAYQASLVFWANKVLTSIGWDQSSSPLQIHQLTPVKLNKVSKVFSAFSAYCQGKIRLLAGEVFSRTIAEARLFNPDKSNNVDNILDADYLAGYVLDERSSEIRTVWQFAKEAGQQSEDKLTATEPYAGLLL